MLLVGSTPDARQYPGRAATPFPHTLPHTLPAANPRFEELICAVVARFAGARADSIDAQIGLGLRDVLAFTGGDQCAFLTLTSAGDGQVSHLAHAPGVEPTDMALGPAQVGPWMHDLARYMQTGAFRRWDDLPPQAVKQRTFEDALGSRSALYVPCPVDGLVRHVLAIVGSRTQLEWPPRLVESFKVLGRVFGDALDRKHIAERTRRELQAAERFALSTLNALHKYVCVVDPQGTIVRVSDCWRTFVEASGGDPEESSVGRNYLAALDAASSRDNDPWAKLAGGVRAVLRGESEEFTLETACHSAATARWFDSKVIRFVAEGRTYAAISHEDITARKVSERELQNLLAKHWHAERITRTGLLIASLAHELSQPLAAILNNAQAALRLLARHRLGDDDAADILKDIVADDKRAGTIIESLRCMLRRQKTDRKVLDVSRLTRDVLQLVHSELLALQVEVVADSEFPPGCFVQADRAQIQQVLLNLLMNAMDAMQPMAPSERHLRIEVSPTVDGAVRVAVADTGIGITQEALGQVFEAFSTSKSRGTGMGLAISRSIVEAHGGRIWAERNRERGTTFVFTLAAVPAPGTAAVRI